MTFLKRVRDQVERPGFKTLMASLIDEAEEKAIAEAERSMDASTLALLVRTMLRLVPDRHVPAREDDLGNRMNDVLPADDDDADVLPG